MLVSAHTATRGGFRSHGVGSFFACKRYILTDSVRFDAFVAERYNK